MIHRSPSAAEPHETGTHSETVNRYLEAIYYMDAEGEAVRASRLADWLGVSQPTAGAALQRMIRDGLVAMSPAKVVALTPSGLEAATAVVRRHRIAERWLTDVLELDWVAADQEAGRLEHALSDRVSDRLHRLLGEPTTCPHGNPIPGTPAPEVREVRMSQVLPGDACRLVRVSEVAEHQAPDLLRFLGEHGFRLGVPVDVVETSPGAGVITVQVQGRPVTMALEVASKIWVEAR